MQTAGSRSSRTTAGSQDAHSKKEYKTYRENRIARAEEIVRENAEKIKRITISARNNAAGRPSAIYMTGAKLNKQQMRIISKLPKYDSQYIFKKAEVSMKDLSALTAETGDEFAMFTRGGERLIIRGDNKSVNVTIKKAKELKKEGYKWSGHTHPGNDFYCLQASGDDYEILRVFSQKQSVTYNSIGQYLTYSL